jgi:hypothetical protein
MNSSSSETVSLNQLSRMQGFWVWLKHFGALFLIPLCAALGALPGALVLYKWHDGPVVGILAIIGCLGGALGAGVWCFIKCSRVVQGLILAYWIGSLLYLVICFLLGLLWGSFSGFLDGFSPGILEKLLGEEGTQVITCETRKTEIETESAAESREAEEESNPLDAIIYREKNGKKFFFTFQMMDEMHAVIYSGLVGRTGRKSTLEGENLEDLQQKLRDEFMKRGTLGYNHCGKGFVLELCYPVTGPSGTPEEWEKCRRLRLFLDDYLCVRGLGGCEGGRSYAGNRVLRCFVVDYVLAESCIREVLGNSEFGLPSRISLE